MKLIRHLYTWKLVDFFGHTISVPLDTRAITCDKHGFVAALFPNYKDKEWFYSNNFDKYPWGTACTRYCETSGEWLHNCVTVDSVLVAKVVFEGEDPANLRLDIPEGDVNV